MAGWAENKTSGHHFPKKDQCGFGVELTNGKWISVAGIKCPELTPHTALMSAA